MKSGSSKPKDERTRIWTIIVYEDSAPDDWREIIRAEHCKAWVSPYHDSDISADGSPKKPHWHVVLAYAGKKSINQIQAVSDKLSGVKVLWEQCAVADLRGMVRYLVHFDDANKHQYRMDEIECYGGADKLEFFQGADDVDECVGQMLDWLDEQGVTSFSMLARYARANRPDWFRVLSSKRTVFIAQYCKSLQWEFEHLKQ
jgi:hypothetical protein